MRGCAIINAGTGPLEGISLNSRGYEGAGAGAETLRLRPLPAFLACTGSVRPQDCIYESDLEYERQ